MEEIDIRNRCESFARDYGIEYELRLDPATLTRMHVFYVRKKGSDDRTKICEVSHEVMLDTFESEVAIMTTFSSIICERDKIIGQESASVPEPERRERETDEAPEIGTKRKDVLEMTTIERIQYVLDELWQKANDLTVLSVDKHDNSCSKATVLSLASSIIEDVDTCKTIIRHELIPEFCENGKNA